ncbi:MAG: hypothetical protein M3P01_06320 [Actinomycetota bacterium]|nr:hypothetical protein [Actinomycetota bacterium]
MRNRTAGAIVALVLVVAGCGAQVTPGTTTRIFVQNALAHPLVVRTTGATVAYFAVPVGATLEIPGNDPQEAIAIFDDQCVRRSYADGRGENQAVVFYISDGTESPGNALPSGAPMASPTDSHC